MSSRPPVAEVEDANPVALDPAPSNEDFAIQAAPVAAITATTVMDPDDDPATILADIRAGWPPWTPGASNPRYVIGVGAPCVPPDHGRFRRRGPTRRSDTPDRDHRPAGVPLPLARHAQRGVRGVRAELGVSGLRGRGRTRGRSPVRPGRSRMQRAQRDDPHKQAVMSIARPSRSPRPRSAPQIARSRWRGWVRADNIDAEGFQRAWTRRSRRMSPRVSCC